MLARLVFAIFLLGQASTVLASEIRVGVLAYRGAERAEAEWEATIHQLNETLPGLGFKAFPYDLSGLRQAVAENRVDFVITNPGHYVELETEFHIARIATVETADGPPSSMAVASTIVTRADSDLRKLEDVKGRRVAAVAIDAFGGFRLAWREMAAQKIDPFTDVRQLMFTGFPIERVADAVIAGEADAGIIRACLLEQMIAEKRLRPGELRVLNERLAPELKCEVSTALYPDWPFAKMPSISPALAKQVGTALLSMPERDGRSWTVPADYQAVHELLRDLKIAPYDHLGRRSFAELAVAYWPGLALALLAIGWWVAHVVRVEHLVRLRTEELRASHEQARSQRAELEHGARLALLGEMVSSLAHEINQPLAAIHNYANGCERRLANGSDPDGVRQGVGLIVEQAERAAGIVKRIRAFVRKRTPEQLPLNLNDSATFALDLFEPTAQRQSITIERRMADALPQVLADRIQIEQVILNLLQNAADAMAESPPPHRLTLSTEFSEGMVRLSVADNGPGLPESTRSHLFQPFFTTKPEGLGLGLSLSRSIIESHGGRLWAQDACSSGACFLFVLPQSGDSSP